MASAADHLPSLGVGITYTGLLDPILHENGLVDVLEIEPQTFWIRSADGYRFPDSTIRRMKSLPGRKLIHSVGAPVGGAARPDAKHLQLLRSTVQTFESPWASDHLSFNATPEFSTGFFLPPRQTAANVQRLAENIVHLRQQLGVPLAVETGVNYLKPRPDELADGRFVADVVEAADCGLLLDIHNIFANALNGRQPLDEYLAQLPLDRVWEMHVAGGMELDGFWLDAHSGAIPDAVLDTARRIIPRLPNLRAIIFEIFPSFIEQVGLPLIREQLLRLRDLWNLRPASSASAATARTPELRPSACEYNDAAAWERSLGELVIGRKPETNGDLARQLANDPGVPLIEKLIREFRGSMIVSLLRLTSRLLILAIGKPVFMRLLEEFWSRTPPQFYAILEAERFGDFLEELKIGVPHLSSVLEFERAVMRTMADDQPRLASFTVDPLPLLRALADGKLPDFPSRQGQFEIEITASFLSGNDRESSPESLGALLYH